MQIDFANLQLQYQKYKHDIDAGIQQVLQQSNYIMGEPVVQLENELQQFTQMQHAISCSDGTDALKLAMLALDLTPGDEIITTPFSFISTAESIALLNLTPVFVDIQEHSFNLDPAGICAAITAKTKAILPVSLFGRPADMDEINAIATAHKLNVIIDGAQCFGSTYQGKNTGYFGDIYTTSFFPAKPLGCYGDGGAVFTNNDDLSEKLKMLRIHGQSQRYKHQYLGITGRLDTIQAAVLLAKLPHYAKEIKLRQQVANQYNQALASLIKTPLISPDRSSVWAQYTLRTRQRQQLQQYLSDHHIPTAIHYPIPLHLQQCFAYLGYRKGSFPIAEQMATEVISLPMNPFLSEAQINYICDTISAFV